MQVGISALVTGADDAAFVAEAERLGAASVWVPEVWGQDALTPLGYLAARTTTIKLASAIAAPLCFAVEWSRSPRLPR